MADTSRQRRTLGRMLKKKKQVQERMRIITGYKKNSHATVSDGQGQ